METSKQETEQDVAVHNARQLVDEIEMRLDVIWQERELISGLLEDLAIYLPKP